MAAVNDKNLGCVLYGKNDLRLEEQPIPQPQCEEVQIGIKNVGICGTDIHYWQLGGAAEFYVTKPMLLGHESAGVVTKLGQDVQHLKPGDRIAIEPGVMCRKCEFCKIGRYNLCPYIQYCGCPPNHGNLAQFRVHAADVCHKLPDHVTYEEGAMLEPLSVCVHACKRAELSLGQSVLICGAGTIGLLSLLTAKAMGASKVLVTDLVEQRLCLATNLGADATLMVANKKPEEVAAQVAQLLGGQGPHVSLECSGAESSVQTAVQATRPGGVVVIVGSGPHHVQLPIVSAAVREVDIRPSFSYANCYPVALDMIASGKIDVQPLITHRYKLEQALEAFETARTGAGGAIKVMIDCDK